MDPSNLEWIKIRDRLQVLSQMLYWQWTMRIPAWETQDHSLEMTARQAGMRTTRYIRWLWQVMGWVPYKIVGRHIVVVPALGIRCVPMPRVSTPAPPVDSEPAHTEPGEWVALGERFF